MLYNIENCKYLDSLLIWEAYENVFVYLFNFMVIFQSEITRIFYYNFIKTFTMCLVVNQAQSKNLYKI